MDSTDAIAAYQHAQRLLYANKFLVEQQSYSLLIDGNISLHYYSGHGACISCISNIQKVTGQQTAAARQTSMHFYRSLCWKFTVQCATERSVKIDHFGETKDVLFRPHLKYCC